MQKAAGRAPLGTVSNAGREGIDIWKARIRAEERIWQERDVDREQLRCLLSEGEFPYLMVRDFGPGLGANAMRRLNPQVDQIDMNLGACYHQKLRSNVGDEVPEVKWSRDWSDGFQDIAHLCDSFSQRVMAKAGAPENNAEATADYCTDGVSTFWLGLSYGLPSLDLQQATQGFEDVLQLVLTDPEGYQPVDGQDHAVLSALLEERATDAQLRIDDPSGALSEALLTGSFRHAQAAAKEAKHGKIDWRYESLQITHERLPYGTHALMDSTAVTLPGARWVARRIRPPIEEARRHPAFHPGIRKQIQPAPFNGALRDGRMQLSDTQPDKVRGELGGRGDIWEIHDRKHKEILYLDLEMDRFLNAGYTSDKDGNRVSRMRHPFLDALGRSMIPAIGGHPGFFPCDMPAPLYPKKDDEFKKHGTPLLLIGKKILFALTKAKSHYVNALKRAASTIYEAHPKAGETAKRAVKLNIDGSVFTRAADVPAGETIVPVQHAQPPEQLFRLIDTLIADWCIVQRFPLGELTTRPVADTVGQEEMGMMSGDQWMLEILRKIEVSYGVQVSMAMHLARHFLSEEAWVELVGAEVGKQLFRLIVSEGMSFPPDLPSIRMASKRRDQHPVRVKQILDFDERVSAKIDPILGLPKYDDETWLQEAARSLNLGKLQRYSPDKENLRMVAEAKGKALAELMLAAQPEQGADGGQNGGQNGGSPVDSGPPGGPNGGSAPPTDNPGMTSPGGSAANDRPQTRRGGRRGRSQGMEGRDTEGTLAREVGPV